jgi:spermidine synthase
MLTSCAEPAHRTLKMKLFQNNKTSDTFEILAKARSRYNEIYVLQNGTQREMWFKGGGSFFLQSRMDTATRKLPVLVYSRMMLASLLFHKAPKRILMLGLGGGSISNFLHHRFPEAEIDAVEVDAKVIKLCKEYFYLQETENYRLHAMDARVFVQHQMGKGSYDLILLDVFKSGSVPFHLKTKEFYREIRDILSPEGVVASNLYGKSNLLKPGDRTTFASIFSRLYFFEDPEQVATVLIATSQEHSFSEMDLKASARNFSEEMPFSMPEMANMYKPELLKNTRANIFSDDFSERDFSQVVDDNNTLRGKLFYPIKSHA